MIKRLLEYFYAKAGKAFKGGKGKVAIGQAGLYNLGIHNARLIGGRAPEAKPWKPTP